MNTLLAKLKRERTKVNELTIRDGFRSEKTYFTQKKGNYLYVYLKEDGKYMIYTTNTFDNHKNDGELKNDGRTAIGLLHDKFREFNHCEFKSAFGYVDENFKRCIPKQFVYINEKCKGKIIDHVSSIDGCSQYPSNLMGLLPDAHGSLIIEGRAKPTSEYPFAFYVKSGHCAQYKVFDTHDWIDSPYQLQLFRWEPKESWKFECVPDDKELTILMKASKYNFSREINYFYERRKEDPYAKLVMNASIGMMHTKAYSRYKMAHIVAIAIARANNSIRLRAERIGKLRILHICVDGIIYKGSDIQGLDCKGLGVYHQEFRDCTFRMINPNAYIVMKGDQLVKLKHGAFDHNKDGSPITEDTVKSLMDSDKWVRVKEVNENEEIGE